MLTESRSPDGSFGTNPDPTQFAARLLLRWLEIASLRPSRSQWRRPSERWIAILIDEIGKLLGGATVQLLTQVGSRWEVISQFGGQTGSGPLAEALIPLALDSPQPISHGTTIAVSVHRGGEMLDGSYLPPTGSLGVPIAESSDVSKLHQLAPTVLMVRLPIVTDKAIPPVLIESIVSMGAVLQSLDRHQHQLGVACDAAMHLRRLLDLSIRWSQIEKTDELLEAIASSAADMLGAERASIFLWDKRRGKLIGRPALGVDGGKLEVDDNVGIVGAVLSTGQPRVWNATEDSDSEVNRSVDRRLKFHTRSLVAVPLRSPTGALIGVFEVVNKKQGLFEANDTLRLVDLARHAASAIHDTETRQRLMTVRDRLLRDAASTCQVIGDSPAIRMLRETVARVAKTDLAVLALGENGTGKEVLARSIHFQSSRRDEPFVAVNCAALVESLLESELFGHERGAFTDAIQARQGKFELANGGTLFLDEIGDMSPGGQAKLLRVLEEKIIVRVGGSTPIPVDVRIIAATNQSLNELVATKRFREDLFFRLNVVAFRLPPLRERGEDILMLANHFLAHFATQSGRVQPSFSDEARQALLRHRWPGNVRELRNVMERACYLSLTDTLTEADLGLTPWESPSAAAITTSTTASPLPTRPQYKSSASDLGDATRDFQIAHIQSAIEAKRGNMTAVAESLGLHRSNLYRKMHQLGMKVDDEDVK